MCLLVCQGSAQFVRSRDCAKCASQHSSRARRQRTSPHTHTMGPAGQTKAIGVQEMIGTCQCTQLCSSRPLQQARSFAASLLSLPAHSRTIPQHRERRVPGLACFLKPLGSADCGANAHKTSTQSSRARPSHTISAQPRQLHLRRSSWPSRKGEQRAATTSLY